jgi:hypothetical protein
MILMEPYDIYSLLRFLIITFIKVNLPGLTNQSFGYKSVFNAYFLYTKCMHLFLAISINVM